MLRSTVILLMVSIGSTIYAQSINLRGTVSNQHGHPVPHAVVTLVGQKLADTTDENGKYSIIKNVTAISENLYINVPVSTSISLKKGVIHISVNKTSKTTVEMFDLKGNMLRSVRNKVATAGEYDFHIKDYMPAATIAIIRVRVENKTEIFRFVPLQHMTNKALSSTENSTTSLVLKKQTAAAQLDMLQVTAQNHKEKEIPVSSYESVVNIELDSLALPHFSFFITSLKALQELSGSQKGFGGDLRFGHTGPGAGLRGADSICECIAEKSMPGSKSKKWRAFLSVSADENGKQVNAADRIGTGPWYDRRGRLLAPTLKDLLSTRPLNGDPIIKNDLPNENGIPNHRPDPSKPQVDNHHMLTGSGADGKLYRSTATCNDWTSASTNAGKPMSGFSWPRGSGGGRRSGNWMTGFSCHGCAPGVDIYEQNGAGGSRNDLSVGAGGGYGGFYCFSLNP